MNTNALFAAVLVVAAPAFAQFRFDAATGACVNASGERGLNVGVSGPCSDFANQNLEGQRFTGDLRGARFDGANLRGASFQGALLSNASFIGADLGRAVLTGASLEGAKLVQARLVGAHLEHATLDGASLEGADVRNACLFRASFTGADLRTAVFSKQKFMLAGAVWTNALVLSDTLPFDSSELAARHVTLPGQLAAVTR